MTEHSKHHVHWGNLILTLAIGGVIGYLIGKNAATAATTPAPKPPATV